MSMLDGRGVKMYGSTQITFTDIYGVTRSTAPNDSWEFGADENEKTSAGRCTVCVWRNHNYSDTKTYVVSRVEWLRLSKKTRI